jgi:hypothetical protein
MKKKSHCDLCDHQILSLDKGSICGVTNKKPDFNRTCVRIGFDEKLKDILAELHINIEIGNKDQKKVARGLILNLISGSLIVVGGYLLWQYILNEGYIAYLPAVIIAIGFYLISKPFTQIKTIRDEISRSKYEIEEIKEVLKLYQVSYKVDVTLGEEIHGSQDVKTNINILK